jgi:serine kinase of HPr protein (carbohydrate metabolism regulator)
MNINQRLYYESEFNLIGHTLCKYFEELKKDDPRRKQLGSMMRCLTNMYTFTNTLLIDDMHKTKKLQQLMNDYDKDIQKLNNKINELNNTLRFYNLEQSRFAERNGK